MAAKFYSVAFDPAVNVGTRNGVKSAVVVAESSADALAVLRSLYGNDVDAGWANATATEFSAGADLEGWVLRVEVINPAAHASTYLVESIEVTGAAAATLDDIGALAVTALNATASIAGAAYSSNVLKVAETTDNLGAHRVNAWLFPPGETRVAVPGFIGTITDEGSAGAALTVAFAADAYTIPKITARYKPAQQ